MAKIIIWSPEQAKKELAKRLSFAKKQRQPMEKEWEENDLVLRNTSGEKAKYGGGVSFDGAEDLGEQPEGTNADMGVNYSFKNFRFIHSQLCANPPSVVPRPTSPDGSDKRKADAADRLVRHGMRAYKIKEKVDKTGFNVLRHGIGYTKVCWDTEAGGVLDFDQASGEITMEGDIAIRPINARELYLDPNARLWDDVVYVFEEIDMPYEEACYRFPNAHKQLEKARKKDNNGFNSDLEDMSSENGNPYQTQAYDTIKVYEYWERGTPYTGMLGRHCFLLEDGTLLTKLEANPFRFAPPKDRGLALPEEQTEEKEEGFEIAYLPYGVWTDIDVGDSPYGRSFLCYEGPIQAWYNRLLTVILDCVQIHGVARLLVNENSDIDESTISNTPTDIIKYTGEKPEFMEPMALPAGLHELLNIARQGIDDMGGVNENMFGQQSREQSGFSMQYATNQGNMIRRRLFDNYVSHVEWIYWAYLNLIRKHWDTPRTITVLGKEKAFEAQDIQGADIQGGFDLVVEYGTSLSLDPITRRQELLSLEPLMEKAEQSAVARRVLSMLRLNELDSYIDGEQLAADRQREIFEQMVATNEYIDIAEQENDALMLEFADRYRMSAEFKYLKKEHQDLILAHMKSRKERLAATAQATAPQAPAPGIAGPGAPAPGAGAAAPVTATTQGAGPVPQV